MFARQHTRKSKNSNNSLLIGKPRSRRRSNRPQSSNRSDVMQLQRSIGNRAVGQLLSGNAGPVIQPELTINPPGDKYEQEADRAARQVVDQTSFSREQTVQRQEEKELQAKPVISAIQRRGMEDEEMQMKQADILQRQEAEEEEMQRKQADTMQRQGMEEEEMQMKSDVQRAEEPEEEEPLQAKSAKAEGSPHATPGLEASIRQARGGGQALPDNIRAPMEQAFGADFSGIRVHTDSRSDRLNRSVQARAFTTGRDVFFRSGEYNPASRSGKELLAHELTHVVQQNSLKPSNQQSKIIARQELPGPMTVREQAPMTMHATFPSFRGQVALAIAMGEVGVRERPSGSNRGRCRQGETKGCVDAYTGGRAQPWCAHFVSWAFEQTGFSPFGHRASVNSLRNWGKSQGWYVEKAAVERGEYSPLAGDIFTKPRYEGAGPQRRLVGGHTGFVLRYDPAGGILETVEGNTGDRVQMRTRALNEIDGFIRIGS